MVHYQPQSLEQTEKLKFSIHEDIMTSKYALKTIYEKMKEGDRPKRIKSINKKSLLSIDFNKILIYDERNLASNLKQQMEKSAEEFNNLAYFKKTKYYCQSKPDQIGFEKDKINTESLDEDSDDEERRKEAEKLKNEEKKKDIELKQELETLKPSSSYVQVSSNGMLKTHVDLFKYITEKDDKTQYKQNPEGLDLKYLKEDNSIRFALFDLYKLNGISEIDFEKITFFNGDEFRFDNRERSFIRSLGTYSKLVSSNQNIDQHFYWNGFFNESFLDNFEEEFYKKKIMDQLISGCFDNMTKMRIEFCEKKS